MDALIVYAVQKFVSIHPAVAAAGIFCASVLIWIEAELVAVFWLADRRRYAAFLSAACSALAAWAVSAGIGLVWFRPRPFAGLAGVSELIAKSPLDKSFPSDHATIAFALATAVYLVDRRWGAVFVALALLISAGRVFVGVHYPSDVLAGAALGMAVAVGVHFLVHKVLHTSHRQAKP